MSLKRRRAININIGIIDDLKIRAKKLGLKSHTTLAVAIVLGERPSIPFPNRMESRTMGVSMRESIWLAVRERAVGKGKSSTDIMTRILTGYSKPISEDELKRGEELAAEREAKRALEKPKVRTNPKVTKEDEVEVQEKTNPSPRIDYEKEEEEARKARHARLPKGSSIDPPEKPKKKESGISSQEEHLGGVYSL